MKNITLRSTILVLVFIGCDIGFGQKPREIQINNLISQIPLPENSQGCYETCTTTKNPDGTVKIIDNGPKFTFLNNEVIRLTKVDMNSASANYANAQASAQTSAPTAEQISQMQAEAMQRAQQAMQKGADPSKAAPSSNPYKPPTNVALMQEIGKAQSAVGQINQLTMELSRKLGDVRMEEVHYGPNCPEVRQGSYVGPTCACERQKRIDDEMKSVAARNVCLQKVNGLMHKYIPQIQDQVAIIDKLEADTKYGQTVTDPTTIQLLGSVQRMGLNGLASLLGIASGNWSDGANQYSYVVNALNKTCSTN